MPPTASDLDRLIPPEIVDDPFHRCIERVAATPGVRHILEIGASSGAGSTEALVAGALRNDPVPTIHCLEVSIPRFYALVERHGGRSFVRCYNRSSVPTGSFPDEAEVDAFRRRVWTRFRFIRRATVMGWLRQDLEYLATHGLSGEGIREVREEAGIDGFDVVLIDGSEFTGTAEMEDVYGARFLLLDDVRTFKNHDNDRRLAKDPAYRLVERGRRPRNGWAVYERVAGGRAAASVAGVRP
ncbi:MAG: hypothetical protein KY453_06280 [Gemmatimonadetes bacterium]|nr:hypothetical protein [Gemmatimonadota bacterium]